MLISPKGTLFHCGQDVVRSTAHQYFSQTYCIRSKISRLFTKNKSGSITVNLSYASAYEPYVHILIKKY